MAVRADPWERDGGRAPSGCGCRCGGPDAEWPVPVAGWLFVRATGSVGSEAGHWGEWNTGRRCCWSCCCWTCFCCCQQSRERDNMPEPPLGYPGVDHHWSGHHPRGATWGTAGGHHLTGGHLGHGPRAPPDGGPPGARPAGTT